MQSTVQDPDKWSASAAHYAQGSKQMPQPTSAPVEKLFEQMNTTYPFANASAILDVGTGPGVTLARLIAEFGDQMDGETRLIASDFSSGMIQQVEKQKQEEQEINPIWRRVEAKVLDAQTLDGIEDASISHITGTMVYNLVANGRKALEAAHRVLKPGGIIGMTLGARADWIDLLGIAAKAIRGSAAPTFQFPKGYGTIEGIKSEFDAVGFNSEYVGTVESFIDMSDPKPFIDSFIRGKNPGAMFFIGDYSDMEVDQFVDELLKLILERYPEPPRRLKGALIVAVGRKV